MMTASWSVLDCPGNTGTADTISATMHPADHMSAACWRAVAATRDAPSAVVYCVAPMMSSGAR